jgi:glyoxylase-like metal-dependent hydrolase (beta-lactamase superfamily II)
LRVADGEPVRLANRDWFAVHTPGHTTDHLCLWDPTEGVLLSGDHVLPTITPHISGNSLLDDPLAEFFQSLDKVAALDGLTQCLPAHGHPFEDLGGRCGHIKHHHADRLQLLRDAADSHHDAPVEGWMKVLFKERSWGEMAASETYAHLEHLRVTGEAEARTDDDGLVRFTLVNS